MKTLQSLFLSGLADIYDSERRDAKALPKMAAVAADPGLKEAFLHHYAQSQQHITKVRQVFELLAETPRPQVCKATVALLEEVDRVIGEFNGSPVLDAALIATAQKLEHYEMACYGCLHEWAGLLGYPDAAALLDQNLREEKSANEALSQLARCGTNSAALGGIPATGRGHAPVTAKF
jgi:ferritin-like metal-binding protein YciE